VDNKRKQPIYSRSKPAAQAQDWWLVSRMSTGEPCTFTLASDRAQTGRIVAIQKYTILIASDSGAQALVWKQWLETTEPAQ